MFHSKVFRRTLMAISALILLSSIAFYLLSVPLIRGAIYTLEEHNGRTTLDNVTKLVDSYYLDLEAFRQAMLSSRQRELQNLVRTVEGTIEQKRLAAEASGASTARVQRTIVDELRALRYNESDYFWISDYSSRLLSHPDPKLNGADYSQVRDVNGKLIVPAAVGVARAQGEGFTSYWWRRLDEESPVEKLTFSRNYIPWSWIIASGVYIDDVEIEVRARKERAIAELRRHLASVRLGRTGYMYVFDEQDNMIIHPNKAIEGTNVASLLNPVTGQPIVRDLAAAAARPDHELAYKWDRPTDSGHYVYDKISWVRHHPGLGWYVASSVYADELNESAILVKNRLVSYTVAMLVLAALCVYLLVSRLIAPLNRLSAVALKVKAGDLSAGSGVARDDEIGVLAAAFDEMVTRLRESFATLDQKVVERTEALDKTNSDLRTSLAELEQTVTSLDASKQQNQFLNDFVMRLTRGLEKDDLWSVALSTLTDAAGCQAAALLLTSGARMEVIHCVGLDPSSIPAEGFRADQGLLADAARGADPVTLDLPDELPLTFNAMVAGGRPQRIALFPLKLRNQRQGVLVLAWITAGATNLARETLESASRALSVIIDNQQMLQKFQKLAAFDELTGLYNRRFGLRRFREEVGRSRRVHRPLAIAMLDLDHFKALNDTYGHTAGDAVLTHVAALLQSAMREQDIVVRYGGEEIVIIMPETDRTTAYAAIDRVRAACARETVAWGEEELHMTFSAGVAGLGEEGVASESFGSLLERADRRLYAAKASGRNTVVGEGDGPGALPEERPDTPLDAKPAR